MSDGVVFTGQAADKITEATKWTLAHRGAAGGPSDAGGAAPEVVFVRVTGAVSSGLYPGLVAHWDAGAEDWLEGATAVKLKPANGEALTSGLRYPARPSGLTGAGDHLYVTAPMVSVPFYAKITSGNSAFGNPLLVAGPFDWEAVTPVAGTWTGTGTTGTGAYEAAGNGRVRTGDVVLLWPYTSSYPYLFFSRGGIDVATAADGTFCYKLTFSGAGYSITEHATNKGQYTINFTPTGTVYPGASTDGGTVTAEAQTISGPKAFTTAIFSTGVAHAIGTEGAAVTLKSGGGGTGPDWLAFEGGGAVGAGGAGLRYGAGGRGHSWCVDGVPAWGVSVDGSGVAQHFINGDTGATGSGDTVTVEGGIVTAVSSSGATAGLTAAGWMGF